MWKRSKKKKNVPPSLISKLDGTLQRPMTYGNYRLIHEIWHEWHERNFHCVSDTCVGIQSEPPFN